jgi:hypothetical protein
LEQYTEQPVRWVQEPARRCAARHKRRESSGRACNRVVALLGYQRADDYLGEAGTFTVPRAADKRKRRTRMNAGKTYALTLMAGLPVVVICLFFVIELCLRLFR